MHMMIVDIISPGIVNSVVGTLIGLLTFDILPVDIVYDYFTE
jgi:hypothetical protein